MTAFLVHDRTKLLGRMVGCLLSDQVPGAVVDYCDPTEDQPWLRVDLPDAGQWIAVLQQADDQSVAARAVALGAIAVVPVASDREALARAVAAAQGGERGYLPTELLQWLVSEAFGTSRSSGPVDAIRLTVREREVLTLVAEGLSNAEIAEHLTISTNTVRSHLHALSVKLDATNRMKMVANARARGFLRTSRTQPTTTTLIPA